MPVTGETPNPIGEKSFFDFKLISTLAVLAFGAGTAHYKIASLEKQTEKQEARIERAEDTTSTLNTEMLRSKDKLEAIENTLNAVNTKLDRLLETRTNRAVYQPPRGPSQ